ncbi:MAG: protein-L-isoaspartate O-methyltransferase [Gammaproteobacteria bacterium]|nr:protein-L-isoaspartate O-methyltransferase [Gammaproteobacteria bacterium]
MNFEQARINMIGQQIRTWEVLDQRVLDAIAAVPREEFVPQRYRNLAFADTQIPLAHGQLMMVPKVEGRMLQALAPQAGERALEIGTGSGHVTALLANLAGAVTSVDLYEDFVADASTRLGKLGLASARIVCADALHDWPDGGPWDLVAVTGSVPEMPDDWPERLAPGGRMFLVVGEAPLMEARLITRVGAAQWATESLFETVLPPLIGARPKPVFSL